MLRINGMKLRILTEITTTLKDLIRHSPKLWSTETPSDRNYEDISVKVIALILYDY